MPCRADPSLDSCQLPRDIFTALSRLSIFFDAELPEASRSDYGDAVVQLRKAARLIAHTGNNVEVRMILFFPYVISESISADIQAGNPYAMVLLLYFVLLLSSLEPKFWFLRGWSRRLLAITEAALEDHPKLRRMVNWPRDELYRLDR